jgi:hypothetical protein
MKENRKTMTCTNAVTPPSRVKKQASIKYKTQQCSKPHTDPSSKGQCPAQQQLYDDDVKARPNNTPPPLNDLTMLHNQQGNLQPKQSHQNNDHA